MKNWKFLSLARLLSKACIFMLLALACFAACTGEDTGPPPAPPAPPTPTISVIVIIYNGSDVTQITLSGVQGGSLNFTASVEGINNPPQSVTWSLSGNFSTGTSLYSGVLTIAADEVGGTILRVTATSTADPSKSAWVDVEVIYAMIPEPWDED